MEINITLYKRYIINDVAAECDLIGRTLETAGNADAEGKFSALKELAGYIKSPSDNETKPVVARAMTEGFNAVKEACQRFLVMGRDTDDNRLEALVEALTYEHEEVAESLNDQGNFADKSDGGEASDCYILTTLDVVKGVTYRLVIKRKDAHMRSANGDFKLFVGRDVVATFSAAGEADVVAEWTATETRTANVCLSSHTADLTQLEVDEGAIVTFNFSWQDLGKYDLQLSIDNFNTGVTSTVTSYAHRLIVDHVMAAILKNQQNEGYTKYIATETAAHDNLIKALQARRIFGRHTHDWK